MADKSKADFSGYATRYNMKCTDGRTISNGAFRHSDGARVPLVWQHIHSDPTNILGYAILEHREDGVFAYGFFNETGPAKHAKTLVQHKDIDSMSIFANHLIEKNNLVHKGDIRELSLVLSGANPGATITNVSMAHGDGSVDVEEDEVIIHAGSSIEPVEQPKEEKVAELSHADSSGGRTVADVINEMNEEQKQALYYVAAQIADSNAEDSSMNQSDIDEEGDKYMKHNIFEGDEKGGKTLSHDDLQAFSQGVFDDMHNGKMKFRDAVIKHATTYGIDNISYLFPDAQTLDNEPSFYTRRMGWVPGWMSSTRHTPFSRIKKLWADLTEEGARAKGYITGAEKKEQVFALLKRVTEPTTVYKKQKLDRDDIVDITDMNVVNWMWREMRFMLDEELARAALVGDGRSFGVDEDAINPEKIRPIYGDLPLFTYYLTLNATDTDWIEIIDAIAAARAQYRGKAVPNFYTTNTVLSGMLLLRDTLGHRLYKTPADLAAELRVNEIIEVEVLEGVQRTVAGVGGFTANLLGLIVNPYDYTYGADKGGQIATFDQFDIDFNQEKYLIETRLSGSLLEPKTAIAVERKTA